jgi:hypothetical protein
MPIDTAVAATASEIASARVANSSMPARRRLANDFSKVGEAKPIFPESPVMVVILVAVFFARLGKRDTLQLGESVFALACRFAREAGAGSTELGRSH